MTENQAKLLNDAQTYVSDLFQTKVNKSIHFHTLEHTHDVVNACTLMANHYHLVDDERMALILGAWFHDTGFSSGKAKDHESVSIRLATDFLLQHNCNQPFVEKVISCINATRLPQNPTNHIEQIICDADLFHLGTDSFKEKNRLLREELNDFGEMDISKKAWRKNNIAFLENHHYFTTYAKEHLQPVKEKFLLELKAKENGEDKNFKKEIGKKKDKPNIAPPEEEKKAEDKKKKEKESQTDRGISTVFRIMASNQSNLSHMADNKAHIMISVNSIILSVVVSFLGKELDTNYNLIYPIIAIVITGVLTIVFSVLATRPNVTSGTFTKDDIDNKKTNLLFFGNFHKMNLTDYDWAMTELLGDKDYLYSSMIKDNYFLGIVLAKKYKYLRISYNIFMYGIILSMIAFAIAYSTSGKVLYTPG